MSDVKLMLAIFGSLVIGLGTCFVANYFALSIITGTTLIEKLIQTIAPLLLAMVVTAMATIISIKLLLTGNRLKS